MFWGTGLHLWACARACGRVTQWQLKRRKRPVIAACTVSLEGSQCLNSHNDFTHVLYFQTSLFADTVVSWQLWGWKHTTLLLLFLGDGKEILPKWALEGDRDKERRTPTCKHICGQMDRGLENKMQWNEVLGRYMSIRKGQADTPGGPFCREAPVSEDM